MKIDLETARYYAGLGDIVMLAWLAEGCRRAGQRLVFHRRRDLEVPRMFGLSIDPEPGGRSLDPVFEIEVADRGRGPRLDYIRGFLGIDALPARPALHVAPEDEAWAAKLSADLSGPPVLLFPQAMWRPREWPASYWVDLAWKLHALGYPVVTLLKGEDKRFKNTPTFQWNTPLPRIAALMRHASIVVGNDSLAAHLAGTIGVPTLALMGPTRPTVFAHVPEVQCLTSELDCTGCHFGAPFRAACDQGCMSLYRVFPDQVLQRVSEVASAGPHGRQAAASSSA